jgi:sugar lactone lactonase YvrE
MEARHVPEIPSALVADPACALGEGILWHADQARVIWVDIDLARWHWFDPRSRRTGAASLDARPGSMAIRPDGGLVIADEHGFAFVDGPSVAAVIAGRTDRLRIERRIDLGIAPGHRFNDGAADPYGHFWAGTMADDERPGGGAVFRLSPGGRVTEVFGDTTCSNGIDWSVDGRIMYYIDSPTQRIDSFTFDVDGRLGERRPFIAIDRADGIPDGLTVDAEGGLWVGLWDGFAVARYRPDGTLDRIVPVEAQQVTRACFGDDDLRSLYVVSATRGLSEEELAAGPVAGSLVRARPGIQGRQPFRYAG